MEITVDIDGFKIKAKTWGNKNSTPVLAIHGWLDNANTFDKVAPLLSTDIYLVAIDLPGHGLSDHKTANSSYYIWDYAVDLLHFIKKMEWKKISIIAHSLGTGVASIIAGAMPNLMHSLVFIDGLGAPFVIEDKDLVSSFRKSIQQLNMAKKTKLYGFTPPNTVQFKTESEAIEDRVNNIIGPISTDAATILTKRSLKKIDGGYRWNFDPRIVLPECFKMTEHQAQLFLKAIPCKTLIILGNQGLFASQRRNDRLEAFQNATTHWLPGGHHLHLEASYHQISIEINQFLETEKLTEQL